MASGASDALPLLLEVATEGLNGISGLASTGEADTAATSLGLSAWGLQRVPAHAGARAAASEVLQGLNSNSCDTGDVVIDAADCTGDKAGEEPPSSAAALARCEVGGEAGDAGEAGEAGEAGGEADEAGEACGGAGVAAAQTTGGLGGFSS